MAGGSVPANLAPIFQQASQQTGVPAPVLAGIASVETNMGQNRGPSSTGAVGLMQFEPGTARSVGINPLDDRQAILGAAKLLVQYGFHQDPTRAIGAYNGGPGNPQMGYARQVLSEAQRLAPELQGGGSVPGLSQSGSVPGLQSVTQNVFDQAGFQRAQDRYLAGSFLQDQKNPFDIGPKGASLGPNPLFGPGLLTTKAPSAQDFMSAHTSLQQLAGVPLSLHPVLRAGTVAGGFLPKGAVYVPGRKDQGRDGQTNPGGPIVANGAGTVVAVKSDPNGFGPAYPVVQFSSGPFAGKTIYFGHTLAQVRPGQQVQPGQVISRTGTRPVGNASVPGWFEIGLAPGGVPGPLGQPAPF